MDFVGAFEIEYGIIVYFSRIIVCFCKLYNGWTKSKTFEHYFTGKKMHVRICDAIFRIKLRYVFVNAITIQF